MIANVNFNEEKKDNVIAVPKIHLFFNINKSIKEVNDQQNTWTKLLKICKTIVAFDKYGAFLSKDLKIQF